MKKLIFSIFLVFLINGSAFASWLDVPIESRLSDADMVVFGKITSIDNSTHKNIDVGTITVSEVLKGDSNTSKVEFAWPSKRRGFQTTSDIYYKLAQQGIFILKKLPKSQASASKYFNAGYPKDYQPPERLEIIRLLVGSLASKKKVVLDFFEFEYQGKEKKGPVKIHNTRMVVYSLGNSAYVTTVSKEKKNDRAMKLSDEISSCFFGWVKDCDFEKMESDRLSRGKKIDLNVRIEFVLGNSTGRIQKSRFDNDSGKLFKSFVVDFKNMLMRSDRLKAEKEFLKAHPVCAPDEKTSPEKAPEKKTDSDR